MHWWPLSVPPSVCPMSDTKLSLQSGLRGYSLFDSPHVSKESYLVILYKPFRETQLSLTNCTTDFVIQGRRRQYHSICNVCFPIRKVIIITIITFSGRRTVLDIRLQKCCDVKNQHKWLKRLSYCCTHMTSYYGSISTTPLSHIVSR